MGEVGRGREEGEAVGIPDDPSLAETHYSQVPNTWPILHDYEDGCSSIHFCCVCIIITHLFVLCSHL